MVSHLHKSKTCLPDVPSIEPIPDSASSLLATFVCVCMQIPTLAKRRPGWPEPDWPPGIHGRCFVSEQNIFLPTDLEAYNLNKESNRYIEITSTLYGISIRDYIFPTRANVRLSFQIRKCKILQINIQSYNNLCCGL